MIGAGVCISWNRDFSENGVEISGGEAQKIALARAMYNHPVNSERYCQVCL